MAGGTFTISNGGVFGSLMGTPIINLPQTAVLGLHAIKEKPVAINGKVEIRPMMYLALTYDHRLLDGKHSMKHNNRLRPALTFFNASRQGSRHIFGEDQGVSPTFAFPSLPFKRNTDSGHRYIEDPRKMLVPM